jgi:hypothetical protein
MSAIGEALTLLDARAIWLPTGEPLRHVAAAELKAKDEALKADKMTQAAILEELRRLKDVVGFGGMLSRWESILVTNLALIEKANPCA